MREMFQHRGMRLLVAANLVSMIGSGMNAAAVIWYILQATHSEVSLGLLVALQTLPSLVLLPFTGVLIDREDRRHLMMWLDVCRGLVILLVAVLALTHHVHVWQLYGMTILVSIGFWMFWPTINALVQELTPEDKLLDSNSLMLAAVQGGWVLAGAMVGFVYNKIGLGGILLLDCRHLCGLHRVRVPGAQGTRDRHSSRAAVRCCSSHRRGSLFSRVGRRLSLRAREPSGAAAGPGVGALHRRHDDAGRDLRSAERAHLASRRSRLRVDQRRMGIRSVHQHALRLAADSAQWRESFGDRRPCASSRCRCSCCPRFDGSRSRCPSTS